MRGADQQPAGAVPHDGEFLFAGIALADQVSGGGLEIVEMWFVFLFRHSAFVPLPPVFAPAPDQGMRQHMPPFSRKLSMRRMEAGRCVQCAKTTIALQQRVSPGCHPTGRTFFCVIKRGMSTPSALLQKTCRVS
jgi:hypothetical protein